MMILRRLALVFAIFCGVTASQLPEFAQQYRQRLGGALDELNAIVEQFVSEAKGAGLDSGAAIAVLEANPDTLVQNRGKAMSQAILRRDSLAEDKARMQQAGSFGRLLVLAETYDPTIARRAWGEFEPATPTTPEGFATAGAGALIGYCFLRLLGAPFARRRRVTRKAGPQSSTRAL